MNCTIWTKAPNRILKTTGIVQEIRKRAFYNNTYEKTTHYSDKKHVHSKFGGVESDT